MADNEADPRKQALAIVQQVLQRPRISREERLIQKLKGTLEILGLEEMLDDFDRQRTQRDLRRALDDIKLELEIRDFPVRYQRQKEREDFEHEQFQEEREEFHEPARLYRKQLQSKIDTRRLENEWREMNPPNPAVRIFFLILAFIVGLIFLWAIMPPATKYNIEVGAAQIIAGLGAGFIILLAMTMVGFPIWLIARIRNR